MNPLPLELNNEGQQVFRQLGLGLVNFIKIYREEGQDLFIKAGSGRFKSNKEEIQTWIKNPDSVA
jgi:hypothetical protein